MLSTNPEPDPTADDAADAAEDTSFLNRFHRNGYFGAYPSKENLAALERLGFRYIIRLTIDQEKNVDPYETTLRVIDLPIKDNSVPTDWDEFSYQVVGLVHLLNADHHVYVHCKGGHGRSCLVVACVLYYVFDHMNARDAIEESIRIHNQRTNMSIRWKGIKSPFSKSQYIFLYKFLNPICILKSYNTGYQAGFSGSSLFQIENELGAFSNVDAAFQAVRVHASFTNTHDEMLKLVWLKFRAYPELQANLIHTGVRRIHDHSRYAFGGNLIGKCLMHIRHALILENHCPACFKTETRLKET